MTFAHLFRISCEILSFKFHRAATTKDKTGKQTKETKSCYAPCLQVLRHIMCSFKQNHGAEHWPNQHNTSSRSQRTVRSLPS